MRRSVVSEMCVEDHWRGRDLWGQRAKAPQPTTEGTNAIRYGSMNSHGNAVPIVSLFNHKGGVSKTTTAFNLGWAMADRGRKVLMVDADPQMPQK
jgi:Mrp family chromosome partitioning ATPase